MLQSMNKRTLASFLWFLVGWQAGGVFVSLMALPPLLAFAPGLVIGALVWWDPTALFRARPAKGRRVMPINDFAVGLERNADRRIDQWPLVETERDRV
jgi:hypothetical protein